MKFGSPIPKKRARIEIVPLIDVMFFLLASFMMVSLTLQKLRTLKMSLPSAVAATQLRDQRKPIEVTMDAAGNLQVDQQRSDLSALFDLVKLRAGGDPTQQIFITADPLNPYGRMVSLLDLIKSAGGVQVSFALDPESMEVKP